MAAAPLLRKLDRPELMPANHSRRKPEPNPSTTPLDAFRSDVPPVRGHDVLHNGESQPSAVGGALSTTSRGAACLVRAVEALENMGQIPGRNARTVVLD